MGFAPPCNSTTNPHVSLIENLYRNYLRYDQALVINRQTAEVAVDEETTVKEVTLPLYQARGWLKFLGAVLIVKGVASVFTIVGIVVAWVPIWMGVLLWKAAGLAESAQVTGNKLQLQESLGKLKTYFTIIGILLIVGIIIFLLVMLFMGATIFALVEEHGLHGW